MEKEYIKEYNEFIQNYASGTTTGERIGLVISKMASYYTNANLEYAASLISFNIKARDIEQTVDENTNKIISSSKAKVLSDATVEAQVMIIAKANLENIEQSINALKSLQRGVLTEFSQGNLT